MGRGVFLPFLPFKVTNTSDLSVHLAWTHSEVRRTFSRLNSLNGEKDFFWPAARRTFSCLNSLNDEKVFFLPELAQRREGLFHAWTRSTARRSFSGASTCPGCTSPPPWMHWGPFLFLACICSRARRSFALSRLHSLEGEEVFYSFSPPNARERWGL